MKRYLLVEIISFIKSTKHHKTRISFIDHLERVFHVIRNSDIIKIKTILIIIYLLINLTFLNCSRLHERLPKNSRAHGCCELMMIIGSIRFISIGSKYQSVWPTTSSISLNAILKRWPNSHAANTMLTAQAP